jgi:hypothetical protein
MSDKREHVDRHHGGPGSSHQDATRPDKPDVHTVLGEAGQKKTADGQRNPQRSGTSGGGGERDSHHTHDPEMKG